MDIRGIWKIKELRMPTPEGEKVFTSDNLPDDEQFEEFAKLIHLQTEFAEDGVLNTLMFVPKEMKEEAAEHGVIVREDGYAVIESTTWKEENGKFYYDTKALILFEEPQVFAAPLLLEKRGRKNF